MRVPIIDFMVHLLWIATFPVLRQWLQIRYRMCRQTTQIRQIIVHKCDFPKQKSNTKTNWLSVRRMNNNCTIHDHNSVKYVSFVIQKKKRWQDQAARQTQSSSHIKDMSLPKMEPQQQRQGSHDHIGSKWKTFEWLSRSLEYMVNYISLKLCKHYSGLFFIILSSNTSSVHVFFYSDANIDMIENEKNPKT